MKLVVQTDSRQCFIVGEVWLSPAEDGLVLVSGVLTLFCGLVRSSIKRLDDPSCSSVGPGDNQINTYSMKQSDLYHFETMKMISQA